MNYLVLVTCFMKDKIPYYSIKLSELVFIYLKIKILATDSYIASCATLAC